MKKLPWDSGSYTPLALGDLLPRCSPTPEQRVRVAAACVTWMRDANMTGQPCPINSELVRAILTMDDAAWARDIAGLTQVFAEYERDLSYDSEDPKVRFESTVARSRS